MKKLILISGVVFCLWQLAHSATPITIPGSQFPVVTTPSNDMRFLMVYPPGGLDPNPLKGSNATIRYDNLATSIGNSLSNLVNLPLANVLDFGALSDGTTDDTLAFQQAIATGKVVLVPHNDNAGGTNGYIVSNLILTNNGGVISFNNAKLIFKTGSTGWMFMMGFPVTNNGSFYPTNTEPNNQTIQGLELYGGMDTLPSVEHSNRNGIWFDPYGKGNHASDLFIHGFDGVGFLAQAYRPLSGVSWPQFLETDQARAHFYSLTLQTNSIGLSISSTNSPWPFFDNDTYISEYQNPFDIRCNFNYIGLILSAGNCTLSSSVFSRNYVNVALRPGGNDGHGSITGSLINHSDFGAGDVAGIIGTGIVNGFLFDSCNIWFTGISLTNCTGVTFQNGIFSGGGANVIGGTGNMIRDNMCFNTIPIILQSGGAVNNFAYENYLAINGQKDTSASSMIASVNMQGQTIVTWPPTFQSLQASSTNSVWMAPSNSTPPISWFGTFDARSNVVYQGYVSFGGGGGSGTLLPPNAIGVLTNNGIGGTNWSTNFSGLWIAPGTLPISAADTNWPPRQNYPHVANTNGTGGQIMISTGTNDIYSSLVYTNGPAPSGSGGGNVTNNSVTTLALAGGGFALTNGIFFYSNNTTKVAVSMDTNGVITIATNGLTVVIFNPSNGTITASTLTANGGSVSVIPTNAALVTLITNAASSFTLPVRITNSAPGRAEPEIRYFIVDSATGTPIMTFSNEMTAHKIIYSKGALASVIETNSYFLPVTSTNAVWVMRDESTGSGASVGYITNYLNSL